MKSLLLLLLFAVMTPFASGQSTVVTATVKDPGGNIYQSASVTANFNNPSNLIAKWNNFPMQAITWTTNTNSAGLFSLQLPDLNFIAPATGTFYTFRICASVVPTTPPTLPSPSVPCFTYTSPPCPNAGCITGGTIDISAAIQAVAIPLTGGISGVVTCGPQTVPFSFTPTFDASTFCLFLMTLTGNVTSSTIANPTTGRIIQFEFTQDATGGRTFAWPASVLSPPTVQASANAVSRITLRFNGVNWVNPSDTVSGFAVTGLTVGNCVQATTGGLLTTTSGPCGTSSGTLTGTGSPVAGQGAFWSGAVSLTGSVNWTYSASAGHAMTQGANATDAFFANRFTDSSPTGNFLHFQNNAKNTDLFTVDVTGTLQAGAVPFARVTGTISSSQQNSATGGALGAIQLANDLGGTAGAPTVVGWHFGGTQTPLSGTAPTTGQVLKWNGTNIVGSSSPYTNTGANNSCPQTGSGAGSTNSCTITLNNTEADTGYRVVCMGTGTITGFPFMQGATSRTTTTVTVQYVNGTSNEAQVSGWSQIECIVSR